MEHTAFSPGTCVVCGWRGVGGILCRRRRCSGRFFFDVRYGFVRGKVRTRASKAQRALYLDVKRWVGPRDVCQEVIFPWSIGKTGAGYRYDIVIPDLKMIVEYDSTLHSEYIKHFHGSKSGFLGVQIRDQMKNKMAADHGWGLVRVDERDPEGGIIARREIERRLSN